MIRFFFKALGSHFRAGRTLYALTVLGVALGVASVLSIQIINRNALAAFEGSVTAVSGEADLTVLGRTPSFADSLYVTVLETEGVRAAWPLIRVEVALESVVDDAQRDASFLEVIGLDFFAPMDIPWTSAPGELGVGMETRGWAAVSPTLAKREGWERGDTFRVAVGSRLVDLIVGAEVDFQALSPLASPKMVVMDIAQAQMLIGRPGEIHQIDIKARDIAEVAAVQARLQARLGEGVQVVTPAQREQQAEGLLSAFRLNLTALSLISLFVGLFLVYSSTQASLIRRREEFGLLRSIGATRGQVFAVIVGEVTLLGALGVGLGLPLGYWGAQANVDVVSATLTNLYLLQEISTLEMPVWLYALGAAIGIGGACAGALLPALDMSRRDTRSLLAAFTLHEKVSTAAFRLFAIGIVILAGSLGWYVAWGQGWKHAGFILGVGLLLGLPLLTPFTIKLLCGSIRVRGFGLGYSLKGLAVRLQTTSFAAASLAIAVSMLIGITLMIGSFRKTLEVWIGSSIQADIYIAPASWRGKGSEGALAPDLIEKLTTHESVAAVDRLRGFLGYTPGPEGQGDQRVGIAGVEMGLQGGHVRFPLLQGNSDTVFERVKATDGVLIGETLARKADLWVGDALTLYTPTGPRTFPVAGVYYDYSTEGGAAVMDLGTMAKAFGSGPVNSIALYLKEGYDPEQVVDALKQIDPSALLQIRSNARLRDQVFQIFDQTFAITQLLKGMSLLIAVCGIALMLLVLAREQVSELALYRSLGATRGQIFGIFVGKGLGMGVIGLILGLAGGLLLAGLLIFVINRAYFGWTIQPIIAWGPILQQMGTILAAAVAASLYPALRASRTPATELSRENL